MENNKRLSVKAKTIKKLFAYSGNQCSFKDCKEFLVDDGGTMIGKIAHIRSPVSDGPRYDSACSSEQCREKENLMVLCGKHHDIIDDIDREAEFPTDLLAEYKSEHEARFKKAESALIAKYADMTANIEPTYPQTLQGLASILGISEMVECEEDIKGIKLFADQLATLPHDARGFALELTKRMRRRNTDELLVADVTRAFDLTQSELKEMIDLLYDHQIAVAEENFDGKWVVKVFNRVPHQIGLPTNCNPFNEIIEYCEATGTDPNRFLEDLNFALYDSPIDAETKT